jgi:hypothetical protein
MQAALDEQHQHRVQRRDPKQPIRDVRDQEVELEKRRGRVRQHVHAAEHERQQRRNAREWQHEQLQAVERKEKALDPVDADSQPEHRGQRERETEHHRVLRKDGRMQQHAVYEERDEQQYARRHRHADRYAARAVPRRAWHRRRRHSRRGRIQMTARSQRRGALDHRLERHVPMRTPARDGKSAVQERSEGIQYNIHVRSLH